MTTEPSGAGLPRLTLVLGGARSGKSGHAEGLVLDSGLEPVYLATAEALDDEMRQRIEAHRARREQAGRGVTWRTVEEPLRLLDALHHTCAPERAVLVDCLTLWLSNLMGAGRDVPAETARLSDGLAGLAGPVVMVSNEVGQGVVPVNPMARAFVDHAGRLHQTIAGSADAVILMVGGLPLSLKPAS